MWQFRTTPNTLNEGDIAAGLLDSRGNLQVTLISKNGTNGTAAQSPGEGQSNSAGLVTNAQTMIFNGTTWDRERGPNVFKSLQSVAVVAGAAVTVWTPAAGKKFRVMGFVLSLSVSGSVILKDSSTEILRLQTAAAIGVASPPMGNGILSTVANNVLQVDVGASGNVSGFVFGTEE